MAWYTAWPAKSQTKGHISSLSEVSFPLRPRSTRERTFLGTSSGFPSILTPWKTNIDIFNQFLRFLNTLFKCKQHTEAMTQDRLFKAIAMPFTEFALRVEELKYL